MIDFHGPLLNTQVMPFLLHLLLVLFFIILAAFYHAPWYDERLILENINRGSWSSFLLPGFSVKPVGGQTHYLLWLKTWSLIFGEQILALRAFNFLVLAGLSLALRKIFQNQTRWLWSLLLLCLSSWLGHYVLELKHYFFDVMIMAWSYVIIQSNRDWAKLLLCILLPFYSFVALFYVGTLFLLKFSQGERFPSALRLFLLSISSVGYAWMLQHYGAENQALLVDFWQASFLSAYSGGALVTRLMSVAFTVFKIFLPHLLLLAVAIKFLRFNSSSRTHLVTLLGCLASMIFLSFLKLYPLPVFGEFFAIDRLYVFLIFPLILFLVESLREEFFLKRWSWVILVVFSLYGGYAIKESRQLYHQNGVALEN